MKSSERKLKLDKAEKMFKEGFWHSSGRLFAECGKKKKAFRSADKCLALGEYLACVEIYAVLKDRKKLLKLAEKLEGRKIQKYLLAGKIYAELKKKKEAKKLAEKLEVEGRLDDALEIYKKLKSSYKVGKLKKIIRKKLILGQKLKV